MGKRHFNAEWLDRTDSNSHLLHYWCEKKDEFTATCKLCKKDINVAYMGFGALMQHSEKKIHIGFTTHLEEAKQTGSVKKVTTEGHETVISQSGEQKGKQTVLQEFFTNKSVDPGDHAAEATCQSRTSEQKSIAVSQSTEHVWSVKDAATKAEIIAALQFASQNIPFSCAENLAVCYQQQFPDSSIAKNVSIGATKMSYLVSYGLGPYFNEMTIKDIVQGNSYFTLHFDETITAQVKKQMDLLVCYWSEVDDRVKVTYLMSIMFGHAKVPDVVAEILKSLEKLAIPLKLMLFLGMDGPNVNKSILNKLNAIKKGKGYQQLVICP